MRVVFTAAASRDLLDIATFIAQDNPTRAFSFVDELEAACLSLAEHPRRYPVVDTNLGDGFRRRPYGNYLILYHAAEVELIIGRIVHAATDLEP